MTMNGFASLLAVLATAYGALLLLLYFNQASMLFLPDVPTRSIEATPTAIGLEFEPVAIITEDKMRLDAWFLPAPSGRGTVLFFHGNAGNISHRLDTLALFNRLGLDTLIFDYRGYGRSEGKPSEAGTYLDAEAAWRYLTVQREIAPRQIVLFGRSLGGAVASHLAARHTPGALILESSFTSIPDVAAELYPYLPARWLATIRYNVKADLATVSCPVLVVHSRDDEIIPYTHGRRLYEAAPEPKRFLEIRGGHNEGFVVSGQTYSQGLGEFLQEVLPPE
jgi:fermentation-respiration switch protein FrsA (DUF1100 family)